MTKSLRNAVVISVILHLLIITPLYSVDQLSGKLAADEEMVVEYIRTPKASVSPPGYAAETGRIAPLVLAKGVIVDPVKRAPPKVSTPESEPKPPEASKSAKSAPSIASTQDRIKKEEAIRKTSDYAGYYQSIRDKIRGKLKENYKYYHLDGNVYLVFTLASDGSLVSYDVDRSRSIEDETLAHIATVSLIESAPFSAFPRGISLPQLGFSLVVSFKKNAE